VKKIAILFLLLAGCSSQPKGTHWNYRWDGPPHQVGEIVYLKGDYEKSWCVHEIKGDKALVATYVTKRDRSMIGGSSFNEIKREELPLEVLVRKVMWKDGEPEPPVRK
jgi:hypothetical protein